MLFQVAVLMLSVAVPSLDEKPITLRVWALAKASENTEGENTDGLNTEGENTDGRETEGEKTEGLNTDGLNTDGREHRRARRPTG